MLAVGDQAGGVFDADHGREAVLAGNDGAVSHETADFGDEAGDGDEHR